VSLLFCCLGLLSFIYETDFDTTFGKPLAVFAAVTQTAVCETTMKLGYARISKADGSQTLNLQMDALAAAGVSADQVYSDEASGKRDDRPGLETCLKALREGDTLYIWKLDRLGRDLKHLVTTVRGLSDRSVGCVSSPARAPTSTPRHRAAS
jgi:DNA invertase Pin-like site-specific DNA recombinase